MKKILKYDFFYGSLLKALRGTGVYQALLDHVKVSVTPFFLPKTLISFVFDMLAVSLKLFLKDVANTLLSRPF